MPFGTLLMGTLFTVILITGLGAGYDLVRRDPRAARFTIRGIHGANVLMATVLFFLLMAFLVGDVRIAYVWRNIDLSYPWHQRISGLWVGREGSLLLWTAATLLFLSLDELRAQRKRVAGLALADASGAGPHPPRITTTPDDVTQLRRVVRLTLLVLVAALFGVVVAEDLFAATSADDLAFNPGGRGVNPQLVTLYNTIHPPIVLTGYALTALPAAFALAHLTTGRPGWIGHARRWGHVAFVFLTAGVLLGALWAYIALGWGGYWAWDPVEVGILVPWTVTTAFLHAGLRHDKRGEFPVAAPVLAITGFAASLFSTFIVRAGGIWVSVHSFLGAGDADDAWSRFLAAFDSSAEVRLYTYLLGLILVALLPLVALHVRRIDQGRVPAGPDPSTARNETGALTLLLARFDPQHLFLLGVLLLTLLATVTVTVLLVGIDGFGTNAIREAVFESRTGPFALAAILTMSLAIGLGFIGKRTSLALHAGALAVGAVSGLIAGEGHGAIAMALPVLMLAATLAAWRSVHAVRTLPRAHALRIAGTHLIHLGVVVVLAGHAVVSTFTTDEIIIELDVGETRQVGALWVTLESIETTDRDGNGRMDHIDALVRIRRGDTDHGLVTAGFTYFAGTDHYKPVVGIERGAKSDVYLAPRGFHDPAQDRWVYSNLPLFQQSAQEAMEVDAITLGISTLPFIGLVWTGAGLMVAGAIGVTFSSHRFVPTVVTPKQDAPARSSPPGTVDA